MQLSPQVTFKGVGPVKRLVRNRNGAILQIKTTLTQNPLITSVSSSYGIIYDKTP